MARRMNMNGRGAGLHGDQTTTGATCLSSQAAHTQNGVGHLRLGDATTPCPQCGRAGVIAEGYPAWRVNGVPGEIPGYATHLDQVAKTAKYLKYGGYVGIALGGGASVLKVQEVCRAGETEACRKIRFTEVGGFSGGLGGGAAGASLGGYAAYLFCGAVGIATGGIGGAVCGIVLVGGGSLAGGLGGGVGGEWLGELLYEKVNP